VNCPAKDCDGELRVTNTYRAGERGLTQRRQCLKCGIVATTQTVVIFVDPKPGQGASAVARRMKDAG
jgi:transcriptional regulator NrdR family protein